MLIEINAHSLFSKYFSESGEQTLCAFMACVHALLFEVS